ncbi:hypothetical protein ABT246_37900 [Streptomyces sp. NPDC001553]|uniref:hypothetical protein n=1 Tax=Streptomyces sp. NPDC001553 TaxID=3154385 RepID=UPI00331B96F9
MQRQHAVSTRDFNEQRPAREDRVEADPKGGVIPAVRLPRLSCHIENDSSEGTQMNAAMTLDTAAHLALRVAAVRDSVSLPDLESAEELGQCWRYDAERWYFGAIGSRRTVARDLVQTEEEREVCQGCSVRDRCLSLAVLTGDTADSIHGGLLPVQQREVEAALHRQGNAVVLRLPSRVDPVVEQAA